ncbi:DUF86 domain-containing protein [bacterium]|nr:DUF86 domain-containing protein [bacterium]
MQRDMGFLLSMLISARRVQESVTGFSYDQFISDREKYDSVILQIGNIGESANRVSKHFRESYPQIQWAAIINMRHRMVHGYDLIKLEQVWTAATVSIPELISQLSKLVPSDKL